MSDTQHTDDQQGLEQDKVVGLMKDDRFCMLTSVGDEGRLHAHPMTPQEITDEGDVWFFIDATSHQAANITAEKRVNVSFSDGSTWLSVAGHGDVRQDRAKIDEGHRLVRECLRRNRPGHYQLLAAVNAVHTDAASAADTDWELTTIEESGLIHVYGLLPLVPEAGRAFRQVVEFLS